MVVPLPLFWWLAQTTHPPGFAIQPPLFWLLAGITLCLLELFLPRQFANQGRWIALFLGISALVVSALLWRMGIDWRFIGYYDGFGIQVGYWMGLSLALTVWIRPMLLMRQKRSPTLDAAEAETLTEILPGQVGRVLYEGSSWQACCENYPEAIAPRQKVCVLRRDGNTLIIAPEQLFRP